MLGRKFKSKFSRLVIIGMVAFVSILGIASSTNSQFNSLYMTCGNWRPSVKADCLNRFGQGRNQAGQRTLEIRSIRGNGGNVFVRVSDADSNKTLLESNPGVGGKEVFFYDGRGTSGYDVQTRLHNPGSVVEYKITRN